MLPNQIENDFANYSFESTFKFMIIHRKADTIHRFLETCPLSINLLYVTKAYHYTVR